MGGVDSGDHVRGYYRVRTKFRKFYMYIFTFMLDVAITNAYKIIKYHTQGSQANNMKAFRVKLATQLIAHYNSRKLRGRHSINVKPLPLSHFPLKHPEGERGKCKACLPRRNDTRWFCTDCEAWLCHSGQSESDCFLKWYKYGL